MEWLENVLYVYLHSQVNTQVHISTGRDFAKFLTNDEGYTIGTTVRNQS